MKRPLKLSLIVLLAIIIIGALGVAYYFFVTLKAVKILPDNGVTIALVDSESGQEVTKASQSKTIRVHAGNYTATYSAGEEYQKEVEDISIKSPTTITSPQLHYTTVKLVELLTTEKSALQTTLNTMSNINEYQISAEALYTRGEWYGASLTPVAWYTLDEIGTQVPNPGNILDVVKVIARKVDGQWQIVAGPSVVFSIEDNPTIPEEVIRAVNRLGLAQ